MTPFTLAFLRSRPCRRWAAAWVLMGWFAACASPLLQPASLVLMCAPGGVALVMVDGHGSTPDPHDRPLCPLCVLDAAGLPSVHIAPLLPSHAAALLPAPPPLPPSAQPAALARGPPFVP
ncbi:hypothetical protein [Pseudorhodoferax sp.]|uniref:hypothetical protein n=1 Tax=Pseudorhodoferax sp. TaxID=1993553 RepID=UPI002DD6A372|nr:hypothetical protein [Pseudorhodoferax sp.]